MSILKIKNKTVIITGASDGIGKGLAIHFAKLGFSLGLIARRTELLLKVADECKKNGAIKVEIESVDVTNSTLFRAALDNLEKKLGATDIFISNAGIAGVSKYKKDNHENAIHVLNVNLIASIVGIEWMKERMVQRGSGTIVGVSSVAAARGIPTAGTYSTSKAALTNYFEVLDVELSAFGVDVITIAPGFLYTGMTKSLKGKVPFLIELDTACKRFVQQILNGKRFIVEPKPFLLVYFLMKITPNFIFRFVMIQLMKAHK